MWRLLFKNLYRKKRRTFLTCASVAVSVFLLSMLAIVFVAMTSPLQTAGSRLRMMVHNATALNILLPISYGQRIASVPGVVASTPTSWFGAYYRDPANTFANFAAGADTFFDVYTEAKLPADQMQSFKEDPAGAVAGRRLAERYDWKIGDRITLLGSFYGFEPDLTLRGIYSGGDENMLVFHWKYFNEGLGRTNEVEAFWIRVDRPQSMPQVSRTIDSMFRNNPVQTQTETEAAALMRTVSWLGNVRALILLIGSVVCFAILMIVANTMTLSVSERIPEAAVMRSLGFRRSQIIGLFVGESLALTVAGGLVGLLGAKLLSLAFGKMNFGGLIWADFGMKPATALVSMGLALLIGLLAAALPAYRAGRVNIAEALRYTG